MVKALLYILLTVTHTMPYCTGVKGWGVGFNIYNSIACAVSVYISNTKATILSNFAF